jgi:phage repressor protein C with HTH and peptisase S24 domain
MDIFRDFLDLCCRRHGVSYAELARRIGVTKSYIGQLVHGHSKPPPAARCRQIAEVLELADAEREQLLDLAVRERARTEAREKIAALDATVASLRSAAPEPRLPIPVIGYVAAGETDIAFTDAGLPVGAGLPGEDPIPRWPGVGERAYALRISGESMLPLCPPGSTIVVDPDHTPRSGEPGICQTTEGKTYFKIVYFEPAGRIRLVSTNQAVAPDILLQRTDVRRLQKVIATIYP